jgi:tetratricopeptide (TPR) repeat protein
VARWWQSGPARPATPAGLPGGAPAPPAAGSAELQALPPAADPVAAPADDDPEAAAAQDAYALYRRGQVAAACERYAELARSGREAVRRALAGCRARLAREAYDAGRFAEAAAQYQRALDAYPEPALWGALAVAHARAGELARGQGALEQGLRAFPDHPELLYLLAELQERQGRTQEALGTVRRLLALDDGHGRARTLLARLEREQRFEAGYWSQESPHFLVRYEGAQGIDVGRSVVDLLEQAYESIGRDLGAYPRDRVQVGVYATRTFAEIGGIPPEYAEHVLGFYDAYKLRLRLSASSPDSIGLERLVRHEYAHLVIHLASKGRAPRWLHEGLAQVLEPRPASRYLEMDVALERRHFTLDGLERLFRSNAVGIAYQLSHVLCEFLVERGGMGGIRALLERLGQGEPVRQALGSALSLGVDDVEARLLAAAGRS